MTVESHPMSGQPAAPASTSVRCAVHVPVEPARAFDIFTAHVREWWNRAYSANPAKTPIADIVLETSAGGRWYERSTDGSEHECARVLSCDAPTRLIVNWLATGRPTEVEVVFTPSAPRRTDVTILHRGFDTFGSDAARLRDMHDERWHDLLERFAAYLAQQQRAGERSATRGGVAVSARSVTDGETVLATIEMAATPERLFRALTTAECERWWGADDTYRATAWRSDLRVGGRWSVDIRLAAGNIFPASGEYVEIDAPRRVVLTRRYDFDYPELGRRDTTVTYLLEAVPGGTRVTVRHDGFAGLRGPADHHADGWIGFLEYLAAYVQGQGE